MSYDIYLEKDGKVIEFEKPHNLQGGTYQIGGTTKAWLNITYNYSEFFYKIFGEKGIRTIYGMTGEESIPLLLKKIEQLKNNWTDNYWEATEGNAKLSLVNLLILASLLPEGIWNGD